MCLTPIQKQAIYGSAKNYFGNDAHVRLFGSRLDDESKGGNIDLYIESQLQNAGDLIMAKLQFLRELHKKIGEQKIDVVLYRANHSPDLPIYHISKQTEVLLQR